MGRPRSSEELIAEELIAIATEEEKFFSTTYQGLSHRKLQSLEKWSTLARSENLKYAEQRAVGFLKDLERCVSGELRFLLEISGKLTQRLYSKFDDIHIAPLGKYWGGRNHPGELYTAYALLKGEKSGKASCERPNTKLRLHSAKARKDTSAGDEHDEEPQAELRSGPAILAAHEAHLDEVRDGPQQRHFDNASHNSLPSFIQHPYWNSKLPEQFGKIVWIHNIDEETEKLWDYDPPRLVPSTFNHNPSMIATQVLRFITGASTDKLNIHQHGQRVTSKSKDKMQGLAFNCYNQALLTPEMFPTQHPQRPTTMTDINIPVEPIPPESLSSRWNMCKIISSSLVTPTWAYTDIHYDALYRGYAEPVGGCEKFWILCPPKPNWDVFLDSTGFDNRLAKIGGRLKGCIMAWTNSTNGLEFGSGTLHAVFTTSGGILLSSNYSTSESLTTMSELILGQLNPDFFENCEAVVCQDLEVYRSTLLTTLDIVGLRENALQSWIMLQGPLQMLVQRIAKSSPFQSTVTSTNNVVKGFAVGTAGRSGKCGCGLQDDLGEHITKYHILDLSNSTTPIAPSIDLPSRSVKPSHQVQRNRDQHDSKRPHRNVATVARYTK
ncbi:hypothetical protein V501_02649 [Pseudogymnoascus sp. VKM F-4519 (FW-2642)]|nr:hypothetical protein V501_02649 [Pseudogymnoascus sp. VKM F-4519 (FW-2642)]